MRMGRGSDFSFPGRSLDVTRPSVPGDTATTNFRHPMSVDFTNPDDSTAAQFAAGQFYFIEKKSGLFAQKVIPLAGMADLFFHQAENAVLTRRHNLNADDAQGRKMIFDAAYATSVESFLRTFAPLGVGISSPEPYTGNGPLMRDYTRFSSSTRILPYARRGIALLPASLFGGSVKSGQKLFLTLKEESYSSVSSSRKSVVLKEGDNVLTLQFYSNSSNTPPVAIQDLSFLKYEVPKPPRRTSLMYLHKEEDGKMTLKKGAYWEICTSIHSHKDVDDFRSNDQAAWNDLLSSQMIQVSMNISGPYY
jgi:hypothetical protein